MAEPLEQQLIFDITGALASIQTLDEALGQVATNFETALTSALGTLAATPIELDTSGLSTDLQAALDQAQQPIPVEGDTTALEAEITSAVDQPATIPVDADTADATAAIEGLSSESASIPVDADVSAAQDAIAGLEGEAVTIPVEADTADASASLSDLGGAAGGATPRVLGLSDATAGFAAAAALGRGDVGGLTQATGLLGGGAVAVGGALTAGAGAIGVFFHEALDAQAAVLRLHQTFGDLSGSIEHLKIGDLDADLSKLALSLGSEDDALRNVASTLFLFQTGAGTSRAEALKLSETVLALSSRAVALNPALGHVEDIAGRLGNTLARGGRFASAFGISLSTTEIHAKAAENATRGLGDGTSFAALQIAGAQLAIEKYGSHLQEDIAKGTKNPIIQLEALRQKFRETTEAIGQPLVAPIFTILADIEPLAEQVGRVLGGLAEVTLPLLAAAAPLLVPLGGVLHLTADGLHAIADVITAIPGPMLTLAAGIGVVAVAANTVIPALEAMAAAGALSMGPVGWIALGVGALAVLGGAFDLFGHKTKQVEDDTTALDQVFASSGSGADSLGASLGSLNKAIDDYLKKNLALGTAGKTGVDSANRLGITFHDLDTAVGGTSQNFDKFLDKLNLSRDATGITDKQYHEFVGTLRDGRGTLDENAAATIAAAQAQGLLTDKQVKDAQSAHLARQEHDDYGNAIVDNLTVLRALAPAIDAAANRTNASALAAAQASPAYRDLVVKLATGAITVDTFTGSLDQFGFTAQGASDQAKALSDEITNFGKSVAGALPTAQTAFDNYASTVKSDLDAVNSAIDSGKGNVHDLFATLVRDSDPAKFTENLLKMVASIQSFNTSLGTIAAEGAPALAEFFATLGPEKAGQLAAGFASEPAKARAAEGVITLLDHATATATGEATRRKAEFLAAGGTEAEFIALGVASGAPQVGAAVQSLGEGAAARFHPDFTHPVGPALAAAATFLAADPKIGQAAGQKGIEAVLAFQGTLTPEKAVAIAYAKARDAIARDPTLAAASSTKGRETGGAFKPDIAGAAKAALTQAVPVIQNVGSLTTAAGAAGHSVGVGFDSGMVEGLNSPDQLARVRAAAESVAAAALAAANAKLGIKSPSTVGIKIGNQFVQGIVVGLTATTGIAESGAGLATRISTATSASLSGLGPQLLGNIVAGFNDPATIDAGIKRLQDLIAQATTRSAASSASSSFSQFVSSVISQVPAGAAAISTFGANVSAAASAQTSAFAEAHKASVNYAADQRERRALLAQLGPATEALRVAQVRLFTDTAAHAAPITLGIDKAQLRDAQQAVDGLTAKLGRAVTSLQQDRKDIAHTSGVLSAAQQALAIASSPDAFIRNLNRQTAANRDFQHNLRLLAADGARELARQLAQAGPDAAGKLAAALASSPAKARQAQAALVAADAFTKSYQTYLTQQFAPKVTATVSGIAGGIAKPLGASILSSTSAGAQKALTDIRSTLSQVPSVIKVFGDTSALTSTVGAALPPNAVITVHPIVDALPSVTFPALSVEVQPHVILPLPALEPLHVDVIPNLLPLPSATVATVTAPQPVATVAAAPAALGGTNVLELDLTITLPSGQQVVANPTFQIPSGQGKQVISAAVAAKVKA